MKRQVSIALALVVFSYALVCGQAKQEPPMPPPKPSNPTFDRIKALAGEWEGKGSDGTVVQTTYRVVSNGSAVMNVIDPGGPYEMITMFHMDGKDLMVTHYCSMGNQPRMVARPGTKPNTIEFGFKDVTNVTSANEGYMYGLVLTMIDANHHNQEWIFHENGKKETHDTFTLTRKK